MVLSNKVHRVIYRVMDAPFVQIKRMLKEIEDGHMKRAKMRQGNTKLRLSFNEGVLVLSNMHMIMVL